MCTNIGYAKVTPQMKRANIKLDSATIIIAVKIKTNYVIGTAMMGIIEKKNKEEIG